MGHFDRPDKSKTEILPVPDRLQRLDNELESGSKAIDFVYAVRKNSFGEDYRIRVTVAPVGYHSQTGTPQYMAMAVFGGKKHRAYGKRPSHSYIKLVEQLKWTTSKLTWAKNQPAAQM